eukprot:59183-Chlamydomonas_euryale.AAC.2
MSDGSGKAPEQAPVWRSTSQCERLMDRAKPQSKLQCGGRIGKALEHAPVWWPARYSDTLRHLCGSNLAHAIPLPAICLTPPPPPTFRTGHLWRPVHAVQCVA